VAWSFLPGSDYWNTNLGSIDIIIGTFEGSDRHRRSSRESDMMGRGRTRESTLGTYCQYLNGKRAQAAQAREVLVDSLSDALLRLSSVKSGIMDENDKEKKREKGGRVEEGLNESMVLLPRSCQRGVPSPLSHAQGILR
jgi:hypothetical protein